MFDLQQFVKECQLALDDPKPTQRVEALVREAISDPEAVHAVHLSFLCACFPDCECL